METPTTATDSLKGYLILDRLRDLKDFASRIRAQTFSAPRRWLKTRSFARHFADA
jgi:hypothetical protein